MGWVGSSASISILHPGLASERPLNDIRAQIAEAEVEAMDLDHGFLFIIPPTPCLEPPPLEEMAGTADTVVDEPRHGAVTAALLTAILRDERRVLTVSTVRDGALGLHEVAPSLPSAFGRRGAEAVLEPDFGDRERTLLDRSGEVIRTALAETR